MSLPGAISVLCHLLVPSLFCVLCHFPVPSWCHPCVPMSLPGATSVLCHHPGAISVLCPRVTFQCHSHVTSWCHPRVTSRCHFCAILPCPLAVPRCHIPMLALHVVPCPCATFLCHLHVPECHLHVMSPPSRCHLRVPSMSPWGRVSHPQAPASHPCHIPQPCPYPCPWATSQSVTSECHLRVSHPGVSHPRCHLPVLSPALSPHGTLWETEAWPGGHRRDRGVPWPWEGGDSGRGQLGWQGHAGTCWGHCRPGQGCGGCGSVTITLGVTGGWHREVAHGGGTGVTTPSGCHRCPCPRAVPAVPGVSQGMSQLSPVSPAGRAGTRQCPQAAPVPGGGPAVPGVLGVSRLSPVSPAGRGGAGRALPGEEGQVVAQATPWAWGLCPGHHVLEPGGHVHLERLVALDEGVLQ